MIWMSSICLCEVKHSHNNTSYTCICIQFRIEWIFVFVIVVSLYYLFVYYTLYRRLLITTCILIAMPSSLLSCHHQTLWLKALFKHIMFIAYVKAIEFSCIKFVQIADQNVFLHLFYVHKNSSIVYFYVHEWFFYVRLQ